MLDRFRKLGIVFWFFALEYEAGEVKYLTIKYCYTKLCCHFCVFRYSLLVHWKNFLFGAKREAILFLFGYSKVNSTWIITSGLANQSMPKALFTCVVYTNNIYIIVSKFGSWKQWPTRQEADRSRRQPDGSFFYSFCHNLRLRPQLTAGVGATPLPWHAQLVPSKYWYSF